MIVSGFDPVRREIARMALNKLIADGRIHPSRIEEVVEETQGEIEQRIQKQGERGGSGNGDPWLASASPSIARSALFPNKLQPERVTPFH